MEDLIRAIARAADLDFISVEFAAHPTNGIPEWRASAYRGDRKGKSGRKWGSVSNAGLRNALIGLATEVGQS